MVKEGKKTLAKEDKKEKARIEARNSLEEYIANSFCCCCRYIQDQNKTSLKKSLKAASEWLKKNRNASKEDFDNKKLKLTNLWNNRY
ncbi:Heat shock 70 kDa protein BIP3 [Linum grandiflorum]